MYSVFKNLAERSKSPQSVNSTVIKNSAKPSKSSQSINSTIIKNPAKPSKSPQPVNSTFFKPNIYPIANLKKLPVVRALFEDDFKNLVTQYFRKFPMSELAKLTGILAGFNEGDRWQRLLREDAIVFHCATALDSPMGNNNIVFSEAKKLKLKMGWELAESVFEEYNEKQVHLQVILILNYLIENAHNITKKSVDEPVNIVFHVHRTEKSSSIIFNKVLNLISESLDIEFTRTENERHMPLLKSKVANISFDFGAFDAENGPIYEQADILYSHSLVVGLCPSVKSGDIIVPAGKLTPMDIDTYELGAQRDPIKENALNIETIQKILAQDQKKFIKLINQDKNKVYCSENVAKANHEAQILKIEDFRLSLMILLSGLIDVISDRMITQYFPSAELALKNESDVKPPASTFIKHIKKGNSTFQPPNQKPSSVQNPPIQSPVKPTNKF